MPHLHTLPPERALGFILIALCIAALVGWGADRLHRRVLAPTQLAFVVAWGVGSVASVLPLPNAIATLAIASVFAFVCALVAPSKGRDPMRWATGGFLFSLGALVLLAVLPKRLRRDEESSGSSPGPPGPSR
jgi:peptidoglycan/LPS O-acetylase OafA/YrhL